MKKSQLKLQELGTVSQETKGWIDYKYPEFIPHPHDTCDPPAGRGCFGEPA